MIDQCVVNKTRLFFASPQKRATTIILFFSLLIKKGRRLTPGNESSKENGKAVIAVPTEGQEEADQNKNKTCNHTLPGQANQSALTHQVVHCIWRPAIVVTV